jgi:hypothetical protein
MDKKAQISFNNSEFAQESPTEKNESMASRIIKGIMMAIFLFAISPVLVGISDGMQPYVCGNPTVCLFFKFIVPAVILGGVFGIIKYIWRSE